MPLVYATSFDTYSTEDIGRHWKGRDGANIGYVELKREGRQDGYFSTNGLFSCAWRPLGVESLPMDPADMDSYIVGFRFRSDYRTWYQQDHTILSLQDSLEDADVAALNFSEFHLGWDRGWGQLWNEYDDAVTAPGDMQWELVGDFARPFSANTCRTLFSGRWHYLEYSLDKAAHRFKIRIDGSVEIDTTFSGGWGFLNPVTYLLLGAHDGFWNNTNCDYDDLYVATLDTGFLGPCRIVPVVPRARTLMVFPGDPPSSRWIPVNAPTTVAAVAKVAFDPSSYARLPALTPRELAWTPGGVGSSPAYWRFAELFDFDIPPVNRGGYLSCMARTDQAGNTVATVSVSTYQGHATIPDGTVSAGGYDDNGFQNPATGSWKEYGLALPDYALDAPVEHLGFGGLSGVELPGFAFNNHRTPYGNVDVAQLVLEVLVPDSELPAEAAEPVSTIFVASDDGLWRKLAGHPWTRVYDGACTKIQGPFFQKPRARAKRRGPQLLVLQAAAGWFVSTNHGTSWTPLPLPAGVPAGNVKSIAFMDQDYARALMLVSGMPAGPPTKNGLYTSFDALATWFQKYRPPPGTEYTDVIGNELGNYGQSTYAMAGHNIGDPVSGSTPPLPGNDREMALVGWGYEGSAAEWPLPLYGRGGGPLTADNQGGTPSLGRVLLYTQEQPFVFYQDSAAPLSMACQFQGYYSGPAPNSMRLSSDCTPNRAPFNTGRPRWVAGSGYRKYAHWLDPSTSRGGIYYANRVRDWVLIQPPTAELFIPINHGAPSLALDREESRIVYVLGATTLWTSLDDGLTWASSPAPWTSPRCIFTLEPYPQGRGTGL